ncbi:hypothetical protein [Estrella lausannensis]|uniref:Uncharacterized protein n=1 Tax=Estrella lausannensis TaxID=483423 RepID=A0A0H5DPY2_9BACT|nr:hypothetical protein [Estrella lausannensis]CRX38078.1 hypothetical protein ELAC_0726 [Estrella lausannensis]
MFCSVRSKIPDYHEKFRELSCINTRTTIASLVEGIEESIKPVSAASYSIFSMWPAQSSSQTTAHLEMKRVTKHLKTKLNKWCEEIDRELEGARYTPYLLERLKVVFQEIFEGGKTAILERKIEEASLPLQKLEPLLRKLDKLIMRVVLTPPLEKLTPPRRYSLFRSGGLLPHMVMPGLFGVYPSSRLITRSSLASTSSPLASGRPTLKSLGRSKSLPNISLNSQSRTAKLTREKEIDNLRKELVTKDRSLALESKVSKICVFTPDFGENWTNFLVAGFKSMTEEEEVIAVAKALNALQAINIINGILHDSREEWKICFLIGGLEAQVFEECIPAFDDSQLTILADILSSGSKMQLKWLDQQFYRIRQWYIDACNKTTSRINAMAKKFREDTEGRFLTSSDLQYMSELEGTIALKMHTISDKLLKLIRRVPLHPETKHVLFEGVIKDYRVLLTRLRETKDYEERPAGCLLPIIFRNVFDRAGITDEDEAYDIFGNWNLLYGKDYYEAGIFGNISFEEFKALETVVSNIFPQMRAHLSSQGINKVADLKKLLIFNNHLLTCYLKDARRAVALGDLSREIIARK